MATKGNDIIIMRDGEAIAGMRSNEVETKADTIEVATPAQSEWRQYIVGRKQWSVTTSYLVPASSNVRDLLQVGTSYQLRFRDRSVAGGVVGQAILTTCRITATRGNLVQGTFQFIGNGPLDIG